MDMYIVYDQDSMQVIKTFNGAMAAYGYAEHNNLMCFNRTHPSNKRLVIQLFPQLPSGLQGELNLETGE